MKTKEQKMIAASKSVLVAKRTLKNLINSNAEAHMIALAKKNVESAEARFNFTSAT